MEEKKTFTYEETKEQVVAMARLFGLMFYYFSKNAIDKMGEEEGKEFIAKTVKDFGLERSRYVKKGVEEMGLDLVLKNYDKFLDLPVIGFLDGCPFADVWIEKGAEDYCKLYCDVDIWKYVEYNKDIEVKRLKWVLEGDDECLYDVKQGSNPSEIYRSKKS
jgi:hypothetical protein